jgi:hypothetical protein
MATWRRLIFAGISLSLLLPLHRTCMRAGAVVHSTTRASLPPQLRIREVSPWRRSSLRPSHFAIGSRNGTRDSSRKSHSHRLRSVRPGRLSLRRETSCPAPSVRVCSRTWTRSTVNGLRLLLWPSSSSVTTLRSATPSTQTMPNGSRPFLRLRRCARF